MLYERSLEIEQRLDAVLRLIRTGKYSTPTLAQQLEVSIPTISRCVSALQMSDIRTGSDALQRLTLCSRQE
jgi:Mn-dependent DtxR family transcriptional regulator